jgi:formiminotetrahydrofolate cyclodeaminase
MAGMSEWGIALIAAGSAVAGSIATGWFTRNAGHRQAAAAEHAGNRQAEALIATVQATLDEQRRARRMDQRRQVYLRFITVGQMPRSTPEERRDADQCMEEAMSLIHLEGPPDVVAAAQMFVTTLEWALSAERVADAEEFKELVWPHENRFLQAARTALGITQNTL